MTREILKDLLPIMQAFADGKKIEYSNDGEDWIETETPTWDTDYVYRIKPELRYRPFKNQEECWEEMHKHPDFGWVKDKEKLSYYPIQEVSDTNHYRNLLNDYEFTDGTPFGIKEE